MKEIAEPVGLSGSSLWETRPSAQIPPLSKHSSAGAALTTPVQPLSAATSRGNPEPREGGREKKG